MSLLFIFSACSSLISHQHIMGFRSFSVFGFLLTLLLNVAYVSTTCYNPDGSAQTSPAYQPCVQTVGTVSQCCGTNVRKMSAFPLASRSRGLFISFSLYFHPKRALLPNLFLARF